MTRRRRRILWTLGWYFDEFQRTLKRLFCCFAKHTEIEIPMNLILASPEDFEESEVDEVMITKSVTETG